METQQIIQVGNSIAVTIPKKLAEKFSWKKGEQVFVGNDEASETLIVSKRAPVDDGLNQDYFAWKKKFISKNKALLTRLARFHGKKEV